MTDATRRLPLEERLFQHICLPRQLPGQAVQENVELELSLATRLIKAVREVGDAFPLSSRDAVDTARVSLQICKELNVEAKLDKASVAREFKHLKPNVTLILHIAEQNAALLIYLHSE